MRPVLAMLLFCVLAVQPGHCAPDKPQKADCCSKKGDCKCDCACVCCKKAPIEAPETLDVYVGRDVRLEIKCPKRVSFVPLGEDEDITVSPSFEENVFVVKAYAPGEYRLLAVVASAGEVKFAKIQVTAKHKGPKPGPGPAPGPGPGPVPPADPLVSALQAAFSLESADTRAGYAKSLAEMYRAGAPKVAEAPTGAKLLADARAAAKAMGIPDDAIPLVRARIAVEAKKVIPAGELDDPKKAEVKAFFLRLAGALDLCK